MCSTCGCSAGGKSVVTNPDRLHAAADAGGIHHHEHAHPHDHDGANNLHMHAHDDVDAHEHHPHSHEDAATRTIRLEQDILAKNNRLAERNRGWLEGRRIFAANLMSSPGAGKTTLLER